MNARTRNGHRPTLRRHVTGLTLIEVLVALLVLSIGILGLATLQTASLNFNNASAQRTQATVLAYDMADRMRANRAAAMAGEYDLALPGAPPACAAPAAVGTVAVQDLSTWQMALACRLPLGTGSIARNGNEVTLSVVWDDSHGNETPLQLQFTTEL